MTLRAGEQASAGRPALRHIMRLGVLQQDWEATRPAGPALQKQLAFAWGPVLKEVFAGRTKITTAEGAAGVATTDAEELYDDPDRQKGLQEHRDLRRTDFRQRLLREACEVADSSVANVDLGKPLPIALRSHRQRDADVCYPGGRRHARS